MEEWGDIEIVADTALTWVEILGRFHPVTVHMPIAACLLLLAHEIAGYFNIKGFRDTAPYYTTAAVLSYLPAVATGWVRALEFQSETLNKIMSHRNIMFLALAIMVCLASWRLLSKRAPGWYLIGLLVVCVLTGYSADLGGKLVYGEDYFGGP